MTYLSDFELPRLVGDERLSYNPNPEIYGRLYYDKSAIYTPEMSPGVYPNNFKISLQYNRNSLKEVSEYGTV